MTPSEGVETGIRLYNTETRRVEPLCARDPGIFRMYVCGPTTYTWAHIGHARSYAIYDVLKRVLASRGFRVVHAQNFTDMEEAIARRAKEEELPPFQLARKYEIAYLEDMAALRILPADHYQRASVMVPRMVEIITKLVEKGHAYLVSCEDGPECDVYFDASRAGRFGHLVGMKLEEMTVDAPIAGERRNAADFALWKAHDDWGVTFPSPWGAGRPGWHVECVAMSTQILGSGFDLHGGGLDLVFPHHESETAIGEACFGAPYARHWMHNGFVTAGRAKMSKSKGNFLTIRDALRAHPPEALRRFLLSSPWRAPLEYDPAALEAHVEAVERADRVASDLAEAARGATPKLPPFVTDAVASFEAALGDDLDTPGALGKLDGLVAALDGRKLSPAEACGAIVGLRTMGDALGILWTITEPRRA